MVAIFTILRHIEQLPYSTTPLGLSQAYCSWQGYQMPFAQGVGGGSI